MKEITSHWLTIEKYFHELVDLPSRKQGVLLAALQREAPDTYDTIKKLLAADQESHPIFSQPASVILGELGEEEVKVGQTIGAFEIIKKLGRGAMASVFLAKRIDGQFEQVVAIKIIHSLMQNNSLHELFQKERQILARLNHPHIARLYDGGFTGTGTLYFTMEYVAGDNVTSFLQKRNFTLQEKLRLFLQICEAVQYAHSALIAHLDLKPQNIIVDDDGNVKLLDFGISKLSSTTERPQASFSSKRFTLAYAAPEQIKGEEVTTAADIYSLGVILYEILAGEHPFKQYLVNPQLLKGAALSGTTLKPFIIKNTGDQLYFSGDLTGMVNKCLEKAKENRYSTVNGLIQDIESYLRHYPVSVRKREIAYLGRKYFFRNQKIVLAGGVAAILLISTIIFYTMQLKEQTRAAQFEAGKAQQISSLLTDVFMASDPNVGSGDTLTAGQLLDQGVANLEKNLGGQPELLASMLMKISPIYLNLGQYEKGRKLARMALRLNRSVFEGPHEQLAFNHVLIGKVHYYLGNYDSAEASVLEGVRQYKNLGQTDVNAMADALLELGNNYYDKGRYVRADSIFRMAYRIHQKNLEPPDEDLAYDLHMLGTNQRKLGNFEEAERYLLASLKMKQELFKEPHLEIAYTYNHLGSLYQNMGDIKGSIPYIQKSLEQRKSILGTAHVETIASMANLARAHTKLNDFDAAIPLYEEAISTAHNLFGESHYYVAALVGSIANAYLQKKDFQEAEAMFEKSIRLNETLLPVNDVRKAPSLMGLGATYMEMGEPELAYPRLKEALEIRQSILPENHQLVAQSQQALGECSLALGDYSTAISILEKAFDTFTNSEDANLERNQLIKSLFIACQQANLKDKADHYQNLLSQN